MEPNTIEIDKIFAKYDRNDSPGCALAVLSHGEIVYQRGYGLADLDHDIPISPATVFHVASVSKQFTAAAIILLAQEGKLTLDDPVRAYVPELPDFRVPITIRHLIHHTSGLRDQWELLGLAGWRYSLDLISNRDVLALVSRQKALNFSPGSEFMYSNTGYTLLAEIVQRVSGQSFRQFTSSRIFQPLEMTSTHFRDDHAEVVKNIAYGYVEQDGKFKLSVTNFDTVGATSLLTSVRDLARWDENFYSRGIGGLALIDQMLECGKLNSGTRLDYASGLMVSSYRGLRTVSHGGADAGYRAEFIRFPDQKFSIACLSNLGSVTPAAIATKVADLCLEDVLQAPEPKEEAPRVSPSPAALAQRAGLYLNEEADDFVRLDFRTDKLHAVISDEQSIELVPEGENLFRLGEFPVEIRFACAPQGSPDQAIVTAPMQSPRTYDFIPRSEAKLDRLQDYVGTYYSDEVECRYYVTIKDGTLMLSSIKLSEVPLHPAVNDLFGGWFGRIRFLRDPTGLVSGMRFNSTRIRNFQFDRIG
jgi:CubicO group peptidase (beta-lactamase class C family)